MKLSRRVWTITALLCAAGAVPFGAAIYGSMVRGLNPLTAWACSSVTRGKLGNVSGWDLEIEQTSCDLVTREEAISVYASTHVPPGSRTKWFARRTLLFRYDPESADDLLPSFEATGPDKILISVPAVSSISVENRILGKTTVNYQIGRVFEPDPTGLGQAH
jgi:hypothetical protein